MTKKEIKKLREYINSIEDFEDIKRFVIEVCSFSKISNPCKTDGDYLIAFEEIKEVLLKCLK